MSLAMINDLSGTAASLVAEDLMWLLTDYRTSKDGGNLFAHVVSPSGAHFMAPWVLARRINGGFFYGFGQTGRAGFVGLYAREERVYLHVRRRVYALHEPPESTVTRAATRNHLAVRQGDRTLLSVSYKPVSQRLGYRGEDIDPDEEEDNDFYLWLHRELTESWSDMAKTFSAGWT